MLQFLIVPLFPPLVGHLLCRDQKTDRGKKVLPNEKISLMQALKMYTIFAAISGFEEQFKGTIKPGKLADLIILNKNLAKCSRDEIEELKVEVTIIMVKLFGAKIVH